MTHVDPAKVMMYQDFGSGDMGDADGDDKNITARFPRDILQARWLLLFVRIHFSGPATGTADLTIVIRSSRGSTWNTRLYTIKDVGKGTDVHFRIPPDELAHWVFEADDKLVLEWTNPDVSDDLHWALTAGMLPVEEEG